MGLLFVFILWLIIYVLLSIILGIIALIVGSICFRWAKKKRKRFLAFLSPAVFLAVAGGSSVILLIICSIFAKTDIGIGDCWYAEINDKYNLTSIDQPENGFICRNGNTMAVISDIDKIQVLNEDTVIGKSANKYFILDLKSDSTTYLPNYQSLVRKAASPAIHLEKNEEFYFQKQIVSFCISSVLSMLFSIYILYCFWKIGLSNKWDALYRKLKIEDRR